MLRLIICSSADDGKSTLIRRLLPESSWLNLIVADAPAHEQDTRTLIRDASSADAAIILLDARIGLRSETRRHSFLISLIGIRHVALAINKIDLLNYTEARYRQIEREYREFARRIGWADIPCIPLSALKDDNITKPSQNIPWHDGPPLGAWLQSLDVDEDRLQKLPFRFQVQSINGSSTDPCRFGGTVTSGVIRAGARIRVQPAGRESRISRIFSDHGSVDRAVAGQSVTLSLEDELDISPGDLISATDSPAEVAGQFEATLVWLSEQPMLRGRSYLMRAGLKTVTATVAPLKYEVNVDTLEHVAAEKLEINRIGVCELELDQPICFDPYSENRDTGSFYLIDAWTNQTLGMGMLRFALRRAHNIQIQPIDVDKAARAIIKRQKPCLVWFTGLSGAGKSTIANLVEKSLHAMGYHTYILDGDNVRHGLNKDLGFTAEDRVENIRRIAEVSKLMLDAGLIVLTAFISPFRAERRMARALVERDEFVEVFVNIPLSLAEQRDPKGLYKKARRGEIKNFTGIDSPYEQPEAPEIVLDTASLTAEEAANRVIAVLRRMTVIKGAPDLSPTRDLPSVF